MKKLTAFLLAAMMLLSLTACGNTEIPWKRGDEKEEMISRRDRDVFDDVFLYPEELNDKEDFARIFGSEVEDGWADVEDYKLHGVTGELEFRYYHDEYQISFTADFRGEDWVPSAEQRRAAEQYFADLYSFYKENRWGEPAGKGHEYVGWLFDTTGDDSGFLIYLNSDEAIVDVIYRLDGVLLE